MLKSIYCSERHILKIDNLQLTIIFYVLVGRVSEHMAIVILYFIKILNFKLEPVRLGGGVGG